MKIGLAYNPGTNGYRRFGADRFLEIARAGFSAIDYNMTDTDAAIYKMSDEDLVRTLLDERAEIEKAGLFVSQVHGPWRCPPIDATLEDRIERMEKMKRSIRAAALLGTKYWVVHPLMPYGTGDLVHGGVEDTWKINVEFFSELGAFAKEQGVVICFENMPFLPFSISVPEKIVELIKTLDCENIKMCLDTGHVGVFRALSVGDCIRKCGEHIKVLHIHDNLGDSDSHLFPTKGKIDWNDVSLALREINFDGVFSLESRLPTSSSDKEFLLAGKELYEIAERVQS